MSRYFLSLLVWVVPIVGLTDCQQARVAVLVSEKDTVDEKIRQIIQNDYFCRRKNRGKGGIYVQD